MKTNKEKETEKIINEAKKILNEYVKLEKTLIKEVNKGRVMYIALRNEVEQCRKIKCKTYSKRK